MASVVDTIRIGCLTYAELAAELDAAGRLCFTYWTGIGGREGLDWMSLGAGLGGR